MRLQTVRCHCERRRGIMRVVPPTAHRPDGEFGLVDRELNCLTRRTVSSRAWGDPHPSTLVGQGERGQRLRALEAHRLGILVELAAAANTPTQNLRLVSSCPASALVKTPRSEARLSARLITPKG